MAVQVIIMDTFVIYLPGDLFFLFIYVICVEIVQVEKKVVFIYFYFTVFFIYVEIFSWKVLFISILIASFFFMSKF